MSLARSVRALAAVSALAAGLLTAPRASAQEYLKPVKPVPQPESSPRDRNMPYPAPSPRVLSPVDGSYTYSYAMPAPSLLWLLTQTIPSPEVGGGRVQRTGSDGLQHDSTELAFGMRWQLTPLLWSWGVNRRTPRWRSFVVDPLARNSGSIELNVNGEYFFGHIDRFLVRPGVRGTFPILQRGEYLSASFGTSAYMFDGVPHVAYDFGASVLFGVLGVQLTWAPAHAPLEYIATLRVRYF
ncbi:MAG: hypothetical protein JWP97_935 [Labilithrix sp.]|nr:hypothetical protein [Labilithrix sp.]